MLTVSDMVRQQQQRQQSEKKKLDEKARRAALRGKMGFAKLV
jgi:hypothetical protein